MRHHRSGRKLGRDASHRKALYANLAGALIEHGRIKTTVTKAKAVRPIAWRQSVVLPIPGSPLIRSAEAPCGRASTNESTRAHSASRPTTSGVRPARPASFTRRL